MLSWQAGGEVGGTEDDVKYVDDDDLLQYRELMERIREKHGIEGAFWVEPATGMIFEPEAERAKDFVDEHRDAVEGTVDHGEEIRRRGEEIRRKANLRAQAARARAERIRKEALEKAGEASRRAGVPAGARAGMTPGDDAEELISAAVRSAEEKRQQDGVVIDESGSDDTDVPREGDKWHRHAPGWGNRSARRERRAATPPTWPPVRGKERRKMDREALEAASEPASRRRGDGSEQRSCESPAHDGRGGASDTGNKVILKGEKDGEQEEQEEGDVQGEEKESA